MVLDVFDRLKNPPLTNIQYWSLTLNKPSIPMNALPCHSSSPFAAQRAVLMIPVWCEECEDEMFSGEDDDDNDDDDVDSTTSEWWWCRRTARRCWILLRRLRMGQRLEQSQKHSKDGEGGRKESSWGRRESYAVVERWINSEWLLYRDRKLENEF